jgi:hypothetical protein
MKSLRKTIRVLLPFLFPIFSNACSICNEHNDTVCITGTAKIERMGSERDQGKPTNSEYYDITIVPEAKIPF